MMHDQLCRSAVESSVNMAVPWFLMASWAYYQEDRPIITDGLYDRLCKLLDERWEGVDHRHKHLIDRDALAAGTGFALPAGSYPLIVIGAARQLMGDARRPASPSLPPPPPPQRAVSGTSQLSMF